MLPLLPSVPGEELGGRGLRQETIWRIGEACDFVGVMASSDLETMSMVRGWQPVTGPVRSPRLAS